MIQERNRRLRLSVVAILVAGISTALLRPASLRAATITATIFTDPSPGLCATSGMDGCSLRETIIYANAHPGSTISLLPGTYTLTIPPTPPNLSPIPDPTSGSLKILVDTTITGPATVDGGGLDSVFSIENGAIVLMKDLTVRNGYLEIGSGGGIQNKGILTLVHCNVMDDHAGSGGGIANWPFGKVTLSSGSVVSGNTARYSGGGIAGDVTVIDSTIRDN
ncbi:MAG: hypothetical protein M3008_12115, partial [Chloroflexota bacterium]|nr:hypothetical protein [Chloroflexota bacterium]